MEQPDLFTYKVPEPTEFDTYHQELLDGEKKRCPCCHRWSQVYPRSITKRMVKMLEKMALICERQPWANYVDFCIAGSGDYAKFKMWGLAEQKKHDPDDTATKDSGYWRITEKGRAFLCGQVRIQKTLLVLNNVVIGVKDETTVTVHDCYKEYFHYGRTMEG